MSLLSFSVAGLPEQCLQQPARTEACPHLLYKKSKFDVPILGVKKGEIICLCRTDIPNSDNTLTEVEKINVRVNWRYLTEYYQLSQQEILDLLRE